MHVLHTQTKCDIITSCTSPTPLISKKVSDFPGQRRGKLTAKLKWVIGKKIDCSPHMHADTPAPTYTIRNL